MYYIYIIQSQKAGKNYVGFTNNLRERLRLHNSGKVFSTQPYRPFILIYSEAYLNRKDALEKEKFLKSGWGRNYIQRSLKNYLATQKFRRA